MKRPCLYWYEIVRMLTGERLRSGNWRINSGPTLNLIRTSSACNVRSSYTRSRHAAVIAPSRHGTRSTLYGHDLRLEAKRCRRHGQTSARATVENQIIAVCQSFAGSPSGTSTNKIFHWQPVCDCFFVVVTWAISSIVSEMLRRKLEKCRFTHLNLVTKNRKTQTQTQR